MNGVNVALFLLDGFHFLRLPPQNTSTYVKLKETTLLKWTVQLTKQDLNSKTGVVWVRLEKLINDGNKRNALDSTNYVPITPFRKITDLIRTGNEHVRKIKFDIYEIGFYVTAKQQEDSGYYRAYVKTDDNLDYLSYSYFLKVLGKLSLFLFFLRALFLKMLSHMQNELCCKTSLIFSCKA